MARKSKSLTKAQRTLAFSFPSGTGQVRYIDSGQSLSMINRKLFSQEKLYGIQSIEFLFTPSPPDAPPTFNYEQVNVAVRTAGETWSVHNAWTKGKALHTEMQDLVLDDNPSIKGKWAEFKVFLDGPHRTAFVAGTDNLTPAGVLPGEWDYTRYVMPQHEVDVGTGEPLPADETQVHLIGPSIISPSVGYQSAGLVESYQNSRATVFENAPNVPPGMSQGFFNLLTDSGSQEPELATIIEVENDKPPYETLSYPGGDLNSVEPLIAGFDVANVNNPRGMINGFLAQCGLFEISTVAYDVTGEVVPAPSLIMLVTYAPGNYKGVAAIDMGQ